MVTLRSLRTDWGKVFRFVVLCFFPEFEVINFGFMSPSFKCLSLNYLLDFIRRCNVPV